jgi:tRNA threonylcarbamoyladenosine biosynthesis protein TsaE
VEWFARTLDETLEIGREIGATLSPNRVVSLFGELGAGKTTLSKGIAQGATGVDPDLVHSPTFSYLNIYRGRFPIFHFDLYRLSGVSDFLAMGFDEYLESDGVVLIEWSEKIESILPTDVVRIELFHQEEGGRLIRCT